MSFPQLPSSQANSSSQQRAANPRHALAPRPTSIAAVELQSVPIPGNNATSTQSDAHEHFVQIATTTYAWVSVGIAGVRIFDGSSHGLQVFLSGMPSQVSLRNVSGSEQRYVLRLLQCLLQGVKNSRDC